MGTSIKMNLALRALPYVKGLPEGGVQPYHTGIMELNPFIPDMDAQQAQAVQGIPVDPAHIELCFPTVHDPSLAPTGKHIVTIDVNSQPYRLREGSWDEIKEDRADRVISTIAEYFPKLPDLIEHRQVVTPLDMERLMGLTGGTPSMATWPPTNCCSYGRPEDGRTTARRSPVSTCAARAPIREAASPARTVATRRVRSSGRPADAIPKGAFVTDVPHIVSPPPGPRTQEVLEAQKRVLYRGLAEEVGPFVIRRKSGFEIEDIDGNVYLDCVSAMASVPLGAAHADITDAAVDALRRYGNEDTHYFSHEYVLPLAERLLAIAPDSLARVDIALNGTEAVETAIRFMRRATGRSIVIGFMGVTTARQAPPGPSARKRATCRSAIER